MSYDNTNRGAIWGNTRKEKDTHPDFTGEANIDGVDYWVSAWKRKQGASDKAPALSFSFKPKDQGQQMQSNQPAKGGDDFEDDIPFTKIRNEYCV